MEVPGKINGTIYLWMVHKCLEETDNFKRSIGYVPRRYSSYQMGIRHGIIVEAAINLPPP